MFATDTANMVLFFEEGLYSPNLIFLGKFGELCGDVQKH